jgi:ABC-type iron transport system FetAB permease component
MNESQTNLTETKGESIFNGFMLWAACRCGFQYILIPFLLPLIRLSDSVSIWLNIGISLLAIAVIARNIWRLWHTSWRKRYLIWSAVAISIILVFLYSDFKTLLNFMLAQSL